MYNKFEENLRCIERVAAKEELCWINPYKLPFYLVDSVCQLVVSDDDIADAERRLEKFAPFLMKVFPETADNNGIIESSLVEIPSMQKAITEAYNVKIPGRLFLKMDSHLPIAGSIKARGGIYEVLCHAESLALKNGLITKDDNYVRFAEKELTDFFKQYTIQVGSTGNLGLSIGIMSAVLGFKVKVHMSADAKEWKKEMLRNKGVEVIEYKNDYSHAVAEGRKLSSMDDKSYFVDDEKSIQLLIGYAVAAKRLKAQFDERNIIVDNKHPLIVYLPAGVGGAPGGICYGLKRVFGDDAHCFFVEPTLFPSVLLGIGTQKHEEANVNNYGISGITAADGLACACPSGLVTRLVTNSVSGDFTFRDGVIYDYLRLLNSSEGIRIEPSSCSAFEGVRKLLEYDSTNSYLKENELTDDILANSIQIAWATGGRLVPEADFEEFLNTYME